MKLKKKKKNTFRHMMNIVLKNLVFQLMSLQLQDYIVIK